MTTPDATPIVRPISDESAVTGRLFWEITTVGGSTTPGNRPLTGSGATLLADLPRPQDPGNSIELWVVLTDALGATTESARQTFTATTSGSC